MSILINNTGVIKQGIELQKISLHNRNGNKAVFTNYGAILCEYHIVKPDGNIQDIVLGFEDPSHYFQKEYMASNPHFGAIIGQTANRIAFGKYSLNGRQYQLETNLADHHLHGGSNGWGTQMWSLTKQNNDANNPSICFELRVQNATNGYTGNLIAQVQYTLAPNNLMIEIRVETDTDAIVNVTQHSYFNLNDDVSAISNHLVQMKAERYLEQDKDCCATGNLVAVDNTIFDFRNYQSIYKQCVDANGYDYSFEVAEWNNQIQCVAKVKTPLSDYSLEIWSNAPCVHFYTGPYIPSLKGKKGIDYHASSGLCFETQHPPNAINIPHFPSIVLKKGETYFQKICYNIAFEK